MKDFNKRYLAYYTKTKIIYKLQLKESIVF